MYSEAVFVCDSILFQIENIEKELKPSKLWSMLDIAISSLILSTLKSSRIQDINNYLDNIEYLLRRLKQELTSIDIELTRDFIGKNFAIFDIFFDNFFVDIFVYSRIKKLHKEIKDLKEQIIQLRDDLVNNNI